MTPPTAYYTAASLNVQLLWGIVHVAAIAYIVSNRPVFAASVKYASYRPEDDRIVFRIDNTKFVPKNPADWRKVDDEALYGAPLDATYDFGSALNDTTLWDRGNRCKDRDREEFLGAGGGNPKNHQQSPIVLTQQTSLVCDDRHALRSPGQGKCAIDELDFKVSAYGLRAEFNRCRNRPNTDYSWNPNPWDLVYIGAKVPGEHRMELADGTIEEFDGELSLVHTGTGPAGGQLIGVVSILLRVAENDIPDDELEKYLVGWEAAQAGQYQACGVVFNATSCALDESSSSSDGTRALLIDGTDGAREGRTTDNTSKRREKGNPPKMQENMETNYNSEATKQAGTVDRGREQKRDRRKLDKIECGGYYCPHSLWRNTGTEYYWRYKGSLTSPPCSEIVRYRVMIQPLLISRDQLDRLEMLIAKHLDSDCKIANVGKPRNDGSCKVDVNRPIQYLSNKHDLRNCKDKWVEEANKAPSLMMAAKNRTAFTAFEGNHEN